jgi:hypothetical protein
MIVVIVLLILSVLVAVSVGGKRAIGQEWSLFFCLTFSVLIGLIISLMSDPKGNGNKKSSSGMMTLFIVLGSLLFLCFMGALTRPDFTQLQCVSVLLPAIGFFGAAVYLKREKFAA